MPRKGVPYGGGICSLKERIAELFDLVGEKLHSINGVQGDGQGNVKVVSGDPAVVITGDAAQNEIKIALDDSKLPSAAVSSVNGETGTVVLNAGNIPTKGNANVQTDIDVGKAGLQNCIANINTEREARQNGDAALQANINAVQGAVQADYVKKTGAAQTVTSQIMVPTTATGTRDTQIANGTRIQNDLAAYQPMVRTTGNQLVEGAKNYPNLLQRIYQSNTHIVQSADLTGGEYSSQLVAVTASAVDVNLFFMWHNTRKGIAPQVSQCGFISAGFRPSSMKIVSIAGTVPQNHFAITRRVVDGQHEYRLWSTGQIKNIDIMFEGIGANNVKVWTRDSAPITSTDLTDGYDEVVYL